MSRLRFPSIAARAAAASRAALLAACLLPAGLPAQARDKARRPAAPPAAPRPADGPATAAAPAPAADPTLAEVERALEDARQEMQEAEAEAARELERLGGEVSTAQKRVLALRSELTGAEGKQRELDSELEKLDGKIAAAAEAHTRARDALEVTRNELETQSNGLKERFAGTLAAAEAPAIVTASGEGDLPQRLERLLAQFQLVLDVASSAGKLTAPVQLAASGGKVLPVDALRLGLIAGYYAEPTSGDAGLVLSDGDGKSGFRGESTGFTAAQKAAIARMVEDPSGGGMLPADVSGGAGITSLQTRDSLARWFELGGFCMWPLLIVCLTSIALILERSISLGLRTLGMQARINRVLSLVRSGNPDEAEAYCSRIGGATGSVLHAALVHRHRERSVMEDAVQEALLHNAPAFQSRLSFIALCSAVAPLFGLLGTVTGMITTFKMVTLFGTSDPRFLAGGISEALITTEAGLWIAIPSLLMRGILGAVADAGLGKLEAGALSVVIALVKAQEAPIAAGEVV